MSVVFLSETQRDEARLKSNLRLVEGGRGVREMARVLRISPTTYSRRRKDPTTLTLAEIDRLCRDVKVSMRDFVDGVLSLGGD